MTKITLNDNTLTTEHGEQVYFWMVTLSIPRSDDSRPVVVTQHVLAQDQHGAIMQAICGLSRSGLSINDYHVDGREYSPVAVKIPFLVCGWGCNIH